MQTPSDSVLKAEFQKCAHQAWIEVAASRGTDLTCYCPTASLDERLKWAAANTVGVAATYVRTSAAQQFPRGDAMAAVRYAAKLDYYLPPDLVFVDDANGVANEHPGLAQLLATLTHNPKFILVVPEISRLSRSQLEALENFDVLFVPEASSDEAAAGTGLIPKVSQLGWPPVTGILANSCRSS